MYAVLHFMFTYASFEVVDTGFLHRSSCVERGFQQRQILSRYRNHIVSMELQGYIFFGSALQILRDVQKEVVTSQRYQEDCSPHPSPGRDSGERPKQRSRTHVASAVRSWGGDELGADTEDTPLLLQKSQGFLPVNRRPSNQMLVEEMPASRDQQVIFQRCVFNGYVCFCVSCVRVCVSSHERSFLCLECVQCVYVPSRCFHLLVAHTHYIEEQR